MEKVVYLINKVIVSSRKIYNLANKSKISQLEFKSYIAITLMKINKPTFKENIQGEDIAEASDQVNFLQNQIMDDHLKAHFPSKFNLIISVTGY